MSNKMVTTDKGEMLKPKDATARVIDTLEKFKPELARVLPKYVHPDRVVRIATTSLRRNPALFKCSQPSLFECIIQLATLNLEPDTPLQHAHLIPYSGQCTLQLGFRGMLELVKRTGKVSHVEARAVFKGDDFAYSFGLDPVLNHTPHGNTGGGEIEYAYCVVIFNNGNKKFDVMTREELDRIEKKTRGGVWKEHRAEMSKKTVIKRCLKTEQMSAELTTAITLDDALDANLPQKFDVQWDAVEDGTQEPIEVEAKVVSVDGEPTGEPDFEGLAGGK